MKTSNYLSLLAIFLMPLLAKSHVTLEPKTAHAGGYAKLVFRVPHGCDGSDTTKITVQIPKGAVSVKPQVHPGWKISLKKIKLEKPLTSHGKSISESVSEVSWSGGVLPDEFMDEFGISLKLPDGAGEKLFFPVSQKCKKGLTEWNQIATPEHKGHHLEYPAPYLTLDGKKAASHMDHH